MQIKESMNDPTHPARPDLPGVTDSKPKRLRSVSAGTSRTG
jgi:hypothetical protein